ncbi:MAG: MoxR-like ATPase [Gammaproteobacteria bacterium]|jgi:MoxR-like ATPase
MLMTDTSTLRCRVDELRDFMSCRILGQERLISRMLIALLADGHLLVEGMPGMAKTRAVKSMAEGLEGEFQRIQFTPDLLPSDITGTDIYRPQDGSFSFSAGPLFHHIVLADEVNRAPAKVQSALLEAMEERQITVGGTTHKLSQLFFVMATQNPIEQDGTYPLPEAQLDRFLMKITLDYPSLESELEIMQTVRKEAQAATSKNEDSPDQRLLQKDLFQIRSEVLDLHMADPIAEYIARLVQATRDPSPYRDSLSALIAHGASTRAAISLDRCSRATAWLDGRDYVSPEDVQSLAHEVLRHRIHLSYRAESEGYGVDTLIDDLLDLLAVP